MGSETLDRRFWMRPLWFFQAYLGFSVWLFFFGPWPWEVANPVELAVFLVAAQLAVAVGYRLAWPVVNARHGPALMSDPAARLAQGASFTRWAVGLSWAMAIPSSLARTGQWWPDVFSGLSNAGLAYNDNFERLSGGNAFVAFEYLRMLLSPWLLGVLPLTVVYWSQLTRGWRLLAVGSVLFTLAIYLATGVNKGLADLVVTMPWLLLLASHAGLLKVRRLGWKLTLLSVALLSLFLVFFSFGQQTRQGSGVEYGSFFTGDVVLLADSKHFVSKWLPEPVRVVFEAVSRYVVQGYYALSLALQTESPSTWGLGHSMFLARNADAVLGGSYFVHNSLPGVLEDKHGWPQFLLWHSIYPWLASDVGFVGAIAAMAGFGFLLGLAWGRSMRLAGPGWVVLCYLLLILFYYVPANNQIFQSGESLVAFAVLVGGFALRALLGRPAPAVAVAPGEGR